MGVSSVQKKIIILSGGFSCASVCVSVLCVFEYTKRKGKGVRVSVFRVGFPSAISETTKRNWRGGLMQKMKEEKNKGNDVPEKEG